MTPGAPNCRYSHGPDDQSRVPVNGSDGAPTDGGKSPALLHMKYPELRKRALQQRGSSAKSETLYARELYVFWKSFLRTSFNVQIYEDFRSFAMQDALQPAPDTYGLERLLGFYGGIFGDKPPVWMQDKPYPHTLLHHQREAEQLSQDIKSRHPPLTG